MGGGRALGCSYFLNFQNWSIKTLDRFNEIWDNVYIDQNKLKGFNHMTNLPLSSNPLNSVLPAILALISTYSPVTIAITEERFSDGPTVDLYDETGALIYFEHTTYDFLDIATTIEEWGMTELVWREYDPDLEMEITLYALVLED